MLIEIAKKKKNCMSLHKSGQFSCNYRIGLLVCAHEKERPKIELQLHRLINGRVSLQIQVLLTSV